MDRDYNKAESLVRQLISFSGGEIPLGGRTYRRGCYEATVLPDGDIRVEKKEISRRKRGARSKTWQFGLLPNLGDLEVDLETASVARREGHSILIGQPSKIIRYPMPIILSAQEFVDLRTSEDHAEQGRASSDPAPEFVWWEVSRWYPEMKFWVVHNKTVPVSVLQHLA